MTCRFSCLSPPLQRRLARVATREGVSCTSMVCDAVVALIEAYRQERQEPATPPPAVRERRREPELELEVVWDGSMKDVSLTGERGQQKER